ncbi:MAG: c-type cytochrome [Nitrosomonadales bacterium]|nr:c-type cytochrome [Nitrosomonadales bacterium]
MKNITAGRVAITDFFEDRGFMKQVIAVALVLMFAGLHGNSWAADKPKNPKPATAPQMVEKGKAIYFKRCSFCHGLLGDGNGPAADYLDPRPRDFTLGTFKFRTTQSGELPTDEDLFRTVSRGLSGTGMQAFDNEVIKNGLTEEERWQVIYYIKTFAQEFANPDLDPYKKTVALPAKAADYNAETIAKGKEVFEKAKCWECHGKSGRGNGQKSFDRKDDWGFPIRIRNVTNPWKIKAGSRVEDIFMRFSTGINGTPMPSFKDSLNDDQRWALANFIKSLQHEPNDQLVLKARRMEGNLPDDPENPEWSKAEYIDVRLAGQVHVAPRWQNPSVEILSARAMYNDKEIAFLVEWDDPFKDTVHKGEMEFDPKDIMNPGAYSSYVAANKVIPRKLETFRDSVAIQFPAKLTEGTQKPHFMRGNSSNPVNLWIWESDLNELGQPSVKNSLANGFKQSSLRVMDKESQTVAGKGVWSEGRWKVLMKRPLSTKDSNDIQFVPGKLIPVAFNAWDGSNGEHGMIMSISTWYFLALEESVPAKVYVFALLGMMVSGLAGWWLVRRVRRDNKEAM